MAVDNRLADSWSVEHNPAVNTKATIERAAVSAKRHVVTSITVTLSAGATAPAAVQVSVVLKDGTTEKWSATMSLPAVAGENAPPITLTGLHIVGSINAAMTLEFSAAAGANTFEAISMQGYDLQDG